MAGRRIELILLISALVFFSVCIFSCASSLQSPSPSSDQKNASMQSSKSTIGSIQETKAATFPQYGAHHDIPYAVVRAGGGGGGSGGGKGGGGKSGGRSGGGSGGVGGAGTGGSHKSSGLPSSKSRTWIFGMSGHVVLTTLIFMM